MARGLVGRVFFFFRVSKLHERDQATKATPHSSGKRMEQPDKHHPVRGLFAPPTTWEHERRFTVQPARSRHQGSTMHLHLPSCSSRKGAMATVSNLCSNNFSR